MLKLGIIGHPLDHTLSPHLHEFLLQGLGLQGSYQAYPTRPDALSERLKWLTQEGFRGVNVTIPHKVSVLNYLDSMSEEVKLIQAANTLVFDEDGRIHGENTDIAGFLNGFPPAALLMLPRCHGLVLGGGGSARSVFTGLIQQGMPEITCAVRSLDKTAPLAELVERLKGAYQAEVTVHWITFDDLKSLSPYGLVLNTTPLGMASLPGSPLAVEILKSLPLTAWVYDLIYRPLKTPLLESAAGLGYPVIDGLPMLVGQGILSLTHWTGKEIPSDLAHQCLKDLEALNILGGSVREFNFDNIGNGS